MGRAEREERQAGRIEQGTGRGRAGIGETRKVCVKKGGREGIMGMRKVGRAGGCEVGAGELGFRKGGRQRSRGPG